jgi:hypothetical protein
MITTTRFKPPIKPIHQTVNGRVVGAKVADLNGNGMPEIYVFVQGAGEIRQAPSKRSAALTGEAVEGIAHSRRGLLCLVLEIAGGVHHLGLHLLGFSLGLHRFIAAQGSGSGLQTALRILSCGLDRVLEAHGLLATESEHRRLAVPLAGP